MRDDDHGRLRRLVHTIAHIADRGGFLAGQSAMPEKGVPLLDRAARLVRRVERMIARPGLARRLGSARTAELAEVARTLADAIAACRAGHAATTAAR
jgi:hypothetical protein